MSLQKSENIEVPHRGTSYNAPPAIIAFTLAIVVVCFAGFALVYFCRCCFLNILHTWAFHRTPSGPIIRLSPGPNDGSPFRGLDPSLLQTFPTFSYSTVKNLRKDKHALECAICLVEFEEESVLRFLTVCCHVFHQDCIDLWLGSHKTCPVCRTDLDERAGHLSIDVKENDDDERVSVTLRREQRYARWHSTGHSVAMVRRDDEDDKYTLRLDNLEENVGLRFVRRGHNYTKSCSSYRDVAASCRNCGFVQTGFGSSSNASIQNVS